MIGRSTLGSAGQQVVTPSRNMQSSPQKSGSNMKSLLQYDSRDDQINNSAARFKQKQPLSYSDFYYSQNPTSKSDYAKMLDAQIEQKKQYQYIQTGHQRNDRNLGKVNNINPHLISEPPVGLAPNYGFQNGAQTQQSAFDFNPSMRNTGTYDNVFNPQNELKRTFKGQNGFTLDRQISQPATQHGSNTLLKLTGQSQTSFVPLRLSHSQINLSYQRAPPIVTNYMLQSQQPSLLNSMQMAQVLQGGSTIQKKTVNFNMTPSNPNSYPSNQRLANGYGSKAVVEEGPSQETFFDKWRDGNHAQSSNPSNFRGILKKENMNEYQIMDKERKQRELNQALQEQILFKKKKQEIEDRQRKLEDLVFTERLKAEQRNEANQRPTSSIDDMTYIKAVAAQQDRMQQRNIISRRISTQNINKQNFDDIKEIPRTPPNQSSRNIISQQEGPIVRIEKIIDFSTNRTKAPSPRNRRSSQGGLGSQDMILTEVKEAAELDMDYIKDYYEFQKKVFNRQMASLQKEVTGVNDQRTQVFKDMLMLREKSKQDHLQALMNPRDVLDDNKYVMAQRKQNLYNFHQLEDLKNQQNGGNPYLQGIQYLPINNQYDFSNYYNDKQANQLITHSQLVPPAQLLKAKGKKKRGSYDNYDHSEQIIGEMRRKLELQDRINKPKPLSAGSRPKLPNKEDSFFRDISKMKGFDKKSNKHNKQNQDASKQQKSVENEFLEQEDEEDMALENSQGISNVSAIHPAGIQGTINTVEDQQNLKRPLSSQNFKEGHHNKIDLEQFRKEVFPGKKLQFEIVREQEKRYQSQVEQYIWDVMSQNSEEYDEMDEKIDDVMGDIEKMVTKETVYNPQPELDQRRLSEIEMQRKMKAFLKGKELQEEHLQLLIREQAKEKLRQIEREQMLLSFQYNKENLSNNPQHYVHNYISNQNHPAGEHEQGGLESNSAYMNDPNNKSNSEHNHKNDKHHNDIKITEDDNSNELSDLDQSKQRENHDRKSNQNSMNNIKEEDELREESQNQQFEHQQPNKLANNEFGKIQETDESGYSDRYQDIHKQNSAQENNQIINSVKREDYKEQQPPHQQNGDIQNNHSRNKSHVNVDQGQLSNLYQQIIDNNNKKYDTNLFEKSLNNIDDMLSIFRDPLKGKQSYQKQ